MAKHTNTEIERAAERFERLTDALDPATAEVEMTDDLRKALGVSRQAATQRFADRAA